LSKRKITGFEVARAILDKHGLTNMYITEVRGTMTDCYDSSRKVVKLSQDVFHGTSIASLAIAAHECGHAIQDKENYGFLAFRETMFPLVSFSSKGGYIAILIGLIFNIRMLLLIGIVLEFIILIFQLITLPVEFDASKRAKKELLEEKMIEKEEGNSVETMLKAAAFTYVAGVISSVLELLRIIFIFGSDRK
jgi:Zn-dependent membrane protease YugP